MEQNVECQNKSNLCLITRGRFKEMVYFEGKCVHIHTLFGTIKQRSMVLLHAVPRSFTSPIQNSWCHLICPPKTYFSECHERTILFKPTQKLGFFNLVYQWWVFAKSRTEHWLYFTSVMEKPGKTYLLRSIPSCKFIFDTYRVELGFCACFDLFTNSYSKNVFQLHRNCIPCSSPKLWINPTARSKGRWEHNFHKIFL